MMMRDFDCFVGIDWSGARGPYQAGLAVFLAEAGHTPPMRVSPPDTQRWSRRAIADWLSDLASRRRVLAGIDFAFAYPIHDMDGSECGYFPEMPNSPQHASALWQLIEDINSDQPYLYGGAIWDHPEYGAYYNAPSGRRGAKFCSRRRQTEQVARAVKSPSPTFNCVGPAGVGTGSLAGMRLLHHFYDSAEIWPFANHRAGSKNLTLVEIFPSYYFHAAGLNPAQRSAVLADLERPLAVVAGAGSGKTSVLTKRVQHMLAHGVAPHHILALTFTKAAAEEMRSRLTAAVGKVAKRTQISTFHSLSLSLCFFLAFPSTHNPPPPQTKTTP